MKNCLVFVVLLSYIKVNAQTINGKVFSENNGKPLGFVTISVKKKTSIYKVGLSDSVGNFSFKDLGVGEFNIDFSSINYQKKNMSLFIQKDTTINAVLVPVSGQLKDVTVSSRKPLIERKIDKLVLNVDNIVNAVGLDALELLSKTPQVKVDGSVISIIGKDVVKVLVNDRDMHLPPEAMASYLHSIPSSNIERIEVMTNPNASYSAEGSSGIINIVLKKNKTLGFSGVANLSLSKNTFAGGVGSVNMNYNKNNIRYFSNVTTGIGNHQPTSSSEIFYPDHIMKQNMTENEASKFINGLIGFDADLSKTDMLGVSLNLFYSYPTQKNSVKTVFTNTGNQKIDSTSEQNNLNKILYNYISSNVHYVKKLDSVYNKRIVIDADYSFNKFNKPNSIENKMFDSNNDIIGNSYSQTLSVNNQNTNIFSLNSVVYLPSKRYNLSFGGNAYFVNASNATSLTINNNVTQIINSQNLFKYSEATQALFINYNRDFGKKWSFQSGLRGEFTQITGHSYSENIIDSINKKQYFNLFPTIYFLYKLNDKNSLSINYGRRINRPSFSSLNPYVKYLSQYQYFEGNPLLNPYASNNIELSETYNNNLTISLQYSYSNNRISGINVVQEGSPVAISKILNFLSSKMFLTSLNYTFNKLSWYQSSNEFDLYYSKSNSNLLITQPVVEGFGAAFSNDNSFFLNKKKSTVLGLSFSYQFPDVSGISNNKRYYFFDLSGKYLLLKNKLQLGWRLSDIFKGKNIRSTYIINGIVTSTYDNNDSRRFSISVRYLFGDAKMKKGQAHSEDTNKGRVN